MAIEALHPTVAPPLRRGQGVFQTTTVFEHVDIAARERMLDKVIQATSSAGRRFRRRQAPGYSPMALPNT